MVISVGGGGWGPPAVPIDYGEIGDAATALSAGSWDDISTLTNVTAITDSTGPSGSSPLTAWTDADSEIPKSHLNWPGKATWDAARKRVVVVGASNGYSSETPVGTHSAFIKLNVESGQFSRQWNPTGTQQAHIYDGNQSLVWNGKVYRKDYDPGHLYACDLTTDTWSLVDTLSVIAYGEISALDVHPNMGASGSVILVSANGRVTSYDIATDTATQLFASTTGVGATGEPVASYSRSLDAIVFGGGQGSGYLYKLTADGTRTLITSTLPTGMTGIGPEGSATETVLLPDPQGRDYAWLFDARTTRKVWRLTLSTGSYDSGSALPTAFAVPRWYTGAAIPELGVHLFIDGDVRSSTTVSTSRVWLFKPA